MLTIATSDRGSFQYKLNSLGSIQPCCQHGTGNYSSTQAITVQPGTHSLLTWESALACKVSCPRTQRQTAAAKSRTQLRPVSTRLQTIVTAPWCPACIWSIYFRCRDTEGSHCQGACSPQWLFAFHSMPGRQHCHLQYVVMRATRDTLSPQRLLFPFWVEQW